MTVTAAPPSPANFVNRIFFGYQNTAALKAALELDVFTAIGSGTLDVAALAAKLGAGGTLVRQNR